MFSHTFTSSLLLAATIASALPSLSQNLSLQNPRQYLSQGGHAKCTAGLVTISAFSNNRALLLNEPDSAYELTTWVADYLQADSDFLERIDGGMHPVNGTFEVDIQLCTPLNGSMSSTVQVLTHGALTSHTYWDVAPDHSYIDFAAAHGYTTLSYDRLGTGRSSKPHPLQVLQAPLECELLHSLVTGLRTGSLGLGHFDRVVGIGFSYGSSLTHALASKYPSDLDAVVLTGYTSNSSSSAAVGLALLNPTPVAQLRPDVYGDLPLAYFSSATAAGYQLSNFHHPNYNLTLGDHEFATRAPLSFGQYVTQDLLVGSANEFRGPVAVLNGANDFAFCLGDCAYPTDQGQVTLSQLYPNKGEGSRAQLFDGIGHSIHVHNNTGEVFAAMRSFFIDSEL